MKEYIIRIYDSHRNLPKDYWDKLGAFYSAEVWGISKEEARDKVIDLFLEYESEYAVKNYELLAFYGKKLVGVMRVLRHPDKREGWYFCDVNVAASHRKKGVASFLYESALDLVNTFYATEYVEASVSSNNEASIALHKKFGFTDTGKKSSYANFSFDISETLYFKRLYTEIKVADDSEEGFHYEVYSGLHSKLEGTEGNVNK